MGELEKLRTLARLAPPDAARFEEALEELEGSAEQLDALTGTDAERDAGLADLLEAALSHQADRDGADCPVCDTAGVLDAAWRRHAEEQVRSRRAKAHRYEDARGRALAAQRALDRLAAGLDPAVVTQTAEEVGLDPGALVDRWGSWQPVLARADGHDVAPLRRAYFEMAAAVTGVADAARAEVERRDDTWRPIAADLRAWLPEARAAVAAQIRLPHLKGAEKWVHGASAALQADRLAPIADAAKRNWERLRQESNVSLEGFELQKSGNTRRAEVAVSVDGSGASAFGVMSQGELHSLAVSVFLPRAGFSESPFRFMVIDDPVQSMDAAKIDGLARVLAEAAHDRQVIVFTHDQRLPEATRRLALDATVLEVTRRPESVVEVRRALDPVERYLEDARALVRSEEVPAHVVERVVPGFCRHALEAACAQAVRRRRLAAGLAHAEVEAALDRCTTLTMHLALTLFDDETKGSQVLSAVNNRFGGRAGDAVKLANKGVHETITRDLRDLVTDSAKLARQLADFRERPSRGRSHAPRARRRGPRPRTPAGVRDTRSVAPRCRARRAPSARGGARRAMGAARARARGGKRQGATHMPAGLPRGSRARLGCVLHMVCPVGRLPPPRVRARTHGARAGAPHRHRPPPCGPVRPRDLSAVVL